MKKLFLWTSCLIFFLVLTLNNYKAVKLQYKDPKFVLEQLYAAATVYYVTTAGNNGNDGLSQANAWADPGYAAEDGGLAAGDIVYIKSGTYQQYGANDYVMKLFSGGSNGNFITWEGYQTSPGDDPTGSNRPVFDGDKDNGDAAQVTNCLYTDDKQNHVFKNIIFKDANGSNVKSGEGVNFINCRFTNAAGDGIESISVGYWGSIMNCEIDNNADTGAEGTIQSVQFFNTYVHDNTSDGFDTGRGDFIVWVTKSIFDTNGGDGFLDYNVGSGDTSLCSENVFYNNTGDGLDLGGNAPTKASPIVNNIFKDNGGYGLKDGTDNTIYLDYNCYHNNTSGSTEDLTLGDNAITNDPSFTDAANGDFTVGSSSPVLDAGLQPSTDLNLTGDYKWNIGVDQDDNTAAGGGTTGHLTIF